MNIKLSEAIRQGAKLRPQGYAAFFHPQSVAAKTENMAQCSCALGAAYDYLSANRLVDVKRIEDLLADIDQELLSEDYEDDEATDFVNDRIEAFVGGGLKEAFPGITDWTIAAPPSLTPTQARRLSVERMKKIGDKYNVQALITWLNDAARWSREDIADYLASQGF